MAKNQRLSREEYEKKKFRYQNVCFKVEEMTLIESFCKTNGESKNGLIRKAVMEYISNFDG